MSRRDLVAITQAVLDARAAVEAWGADVWMNVAMEAPECLADVNTMTWCVTVQAFKSEGEPIVTAAKRLALYLDLHAEVFGRPPRLESVRDNALERARDATTGRWEP